MKKIILLALVAFGMLACSDKNSPLDPNNGALEGKFSVASHNQVQFAQGNLQYKPSTKTWQFAANQYDTIGVNNTKISDSYDGWLDLFGWGTGSNPTQISSIALDYSSFTDWGVNKISNGGNKANLWRTLTMDEWKYLLFKRSHASDLSSLAMVNGVNGCIVLPDDWQTPAGISWIGNASKYTTNQYSLESWAKMEKAGAVFLPAAGMRYAANCSHVDEAGFYWSSTPTKDDDTEANGPYFDEKEKIDWYAYPRRFGQAVRLVHDLN